MFSHYQQKSCLRISFLVVCSILLWTVHCARIPQYPVSEVCSGADSFRFGTINIQGKGSQLAVESKEEMLECDPAPAPQSVLEDLLDATAVMQNHFFAAWKGTWPHAIDWTAAVMATQLSATLGAVARSNKYISKDSPFGTVSANTIAGYFSHISAFYFGENAFALRTQAYDDMLWVVLDWLEVIKFVNSHSDRHFSDGADMASSWHGKHFIPAFAHRARVFWDLASKGWDTTLCGGGMIWSPYLTPYKNAITNQLYIAASISMYLYFPGDDIGFPFDEAQQLSALGLPDVEPHDRKYFEAAVAAYEWLTESQMTNSQGLYVDGFHIKGWRSGRDGSNGTGKCDERNNAVYTYNQGVILTGQRGLWEATGEANYLTHGHSLIRSVINATGFGRNDPLERAEWAGLGREGVLEEICDASGTCSQNGQTFKGIFFHHLATFCEPLPIGTSGPIFHRADKELAKLHERSCQEYVPWISNNAVAVLGTRNANGEFGMWWTPGLHGYGNEIVPTGNQTQEGTDYRNLGVPLDEIWRLPRDLTVLPERKNCDSNPEVKLKKDPNCRGRGRNVETQSGGIAVLKALYIMNELAPEIDG